MTDVRDLLARTGDDQPWTAPGDVTAAVLVRSTRRDRHRRCAAAGALLTLAFAAGGVALLDRPGPARQTLVAGRDDPDRVYGADEKGYPVDADLTGALALLRLPRIGDDYSLRVVEGQTDQDLQRGAGHDPASAAPGESGNVVLAGHRTTYGKPFADLDRLRPGDTVALETATRWFVYRATSSTVVAPDDVTVVAPTPPGEAPGRRLLTLVTCTPRYSATGRLVVRAVLVEDDAKADHPAGWTPAAVTPDAGPAADAGAPALAGEPVTGTSPATVLPFVS